MLENIKERAKGLVEAIEEILSNREEETVISDVDKLFLQTLYQTLQTKRGELSVRYVDLNEKLTKLDEETAAAETLLDDVDSLLEDLEDYK